MVNGYDPATVGVPEITPVDAFSDKPVGNEPELMLQVNGGVPPASKTVWL